MVAAAVSTGGPEVTDWITAEEVADMARTTHRNVAEKLSYKPDFPVPIKPGRKRLWSREEVAAWLEAQRVRASRRSRSRSD